MTGDDQVSGIHPAVADADAQVVAADDFGKPRRSRARTAVISARLGIVLVSGGLYLIGGFGPRLYDAAANAWVASTPDIVLATLGRCACSWRCY